MNELRAELALVVGHVGLPGEPSAVVTMVRQVEGSRPEGADRSARVDWYTRLYLADAIRFTGEDSAEMVIEAIGDRYGDQRVELAVQRKAVVNLNGQDNLLSALRAYRMNLASVSIIDGKETTQTPSGLYGLPKTMLVSTLARIVAQDRFRVIGAVEKKADVAAALNTIRMKAPRRKEVKPGDEVEELVEDPLVLCVQYGTWMSEVKLPWRERPRGGEITYEQYDPLG